MRIEIVNDEDIDLFINIIKIDDNEFNQEADFRIIIYQNEPFLFETEEYEILPKNINKRYYKDKFYIDVEDIEDIIPIIDMGNIVYGPSAKKIIQTSKIVK